MFDSTLSPEILNLESELGYLNMPMAIDKLVGSAVEGVGTGLLEVIFIKTNGSVEEIVRTVILTPNAGFRLSSPARAASGRPEDHNLGRQSGKASLQIRETVNQVREYDRVIPVCT